VTRPAKVWVVGLLSLLVFSGLSGIEAWPVTGWKLFSLSRDATQTNWTLDAITPDGAATVDLEQLPLAFRNAEWPLADLGHASTARREDVCRALLGGVETVVPEATGLRLVREARHMRIVEGDPVIDADREVVHECHA
jgi:hypothetical protein